MKPARNYTHNDVEIAQETPLFQGFFAVKKLTFKYRHFTGNWSNTVSRELIIRHRVAAALPYDPVLDKVILIEQFRIGAMADERSPWLLEAVAGIMDQPEAITSLMQREVKEEAGLDVQASIPITTFWSSPGGTDEKVQLYCAKVDASQAGGIFGLSHEHEDIKVHVVSSQDAFALVESGEINTSPAIIALQWLQLHLTKVRKQWL